MYRLIALDIDDTITLNPRVVPNEIIEAVRKAKEHGIHVTVATGRGWLGSKLIIDQLDVTDPVINYGGAMVNEPRTGRALHANEIPPELVTEVLGEAKTLGIHAHIYQGDKVIAEEPNPYVEGYAEKLDLPCEYDPDIMKKTWYNVPKVLMMTTEEKAQRLIPEFQKKYAGKLKVSGSSKGFIEFNNPDSHKGAGLEWVAGYLGIAQKDTVAVGDNSLDLEMIRWAGLGCAVDNGKPEVKEAADLVIPSCADFGVARLIECIINGKV